MPEDCPECATPLEETTESYYTGVALDGYQERVREDRVFCPLCGWYEPVTYSTGGPPSEWAARLKASLEELKCK